MERSDRSPDARSEARKTILYLAFNPFGPANWLTAIIIVIIYFASVKPLLGVREFCLKNEDRRRGQEKQGCVPESVLDGLVILCLYAVVQYFVLKYGCTVGTMLPPPVGDMYKYTCPDYSKDNTHDPRTRRY